MRSVLRAIRRLAPASTKDISRATSIPVPIVAAVGNELRRRGMLTEKRPSRLTPSGLSLVAELGMDLVLDPTCGTCEGRELVIPDVLDEAVERLTAIMAAGPQADMSLDQSLCTPETKVRRVLALLRAGVLPGGSLLLVGDDDTISLAVAVVGEVLGSPLVERVTVVDISPEILGHIAEVSAGFKTRVDTVEHDLRQPLPEVLHGRFDAAMTDPPYTPEGAQLFLSRAVEGLRPGAANSIFFSFGAKSPNEMLEVQQEIMDLGLVVNGFIRNFNEYEGSGILGGTGFIQHLLTTSATQASVGGSYGGPLYTRDKRSRQREYECVSCEARTPVGPGARWSSVGALRADGCPQCGGGPFKPRQLVSMAATGDGAGPGDGNGAGDGNGVGDSSGARDSNGAGDGPAAGDIPHVRPPAEPASGPGADPVSGAAPGATSGATSFGGSEPVAPASAPVSAAAVEQAPLSVSATVAPGAELPGAELPEPVLPESALPGSPLSGPVLPRDVAGQRTVVWQPPVAREVLASVGERAAPFVTRPADERDLDAIAAFEAEIARISFGDAAVDNPERHRSRLSRAMQKSRAGMYVACGPDDDTAVGWLWMSINQNTMTGDRYANFRSLAVAPIEQRAEVGELLIAEGLAFAVEHELIEVVGKVHVGNVPMRTLYRKYGFESTHMAMKLQLAEVRRAGR
ncbi:GNAT family N-acetyltransferase [Streptomyces sp. NPDC002055]|uniref:GNAT family N-acetyltransferase n=1 Tax=Streptomyces sp. NPDC002055 TaxID=3154534 RepID=UPI00332FFDA1